MKGKKSRRPFKMIYRFLFLILAFGFFASCGATKSHRKAKHPKSTAEVQTQNEEKIKTTEVDEEGDLKTEAIEKEKKTVFFSAIESFPIFPGCEKYKDDRELLNKCNSNKMAEFFARNFNKKIGKKLKIKGDVIIYVFFTVDKDGQIVDIKVNTPYKELIPETKRVLSSMPRWKPAVQRGKKVKVRFALPIRFSISK